MVQKQNIWLPHELTEKDMKRRKTICEVLFQKITRKIFLHHIVKRWKKENSIRQSIATKIIETYMCHCPFKAKAEDS